MYKRQNIKLTSVIKRYIQKLYGSPFLQQRRFITFIFFVVLSASFWFIRSLSEEYESGIDYPIRYINFPDNKILVGNVPYKLKLTVKAKGFTILKSRMNLDLVPLKFNVSSFSLNSIGVDTFYIVTETVKDILSAELKEITIIHISPDTLFFKLSDIAVKKVPVYGNVKFHDKFFQQQYMLNGKIKSDPDSIIISGPKSMIDTISYIITKPIRTTNLSDTLIKNTELTPINLITFSQQKVNIIIPVDRFTEVEEMRPIIPFNVPDSLNMIPIPGQTKVTYRIGLSNYNKVINNPLSPRVNYFDINYNDIIRLPVFLIDTPDYISNLRFYPEVIEFLISRND